MSRRSYRARRPSPSPSSSVPHRSWPRAPIATGTTRTRRTSPRAPTPSLTRSPPWPRSPRSSSACGATSTRPRPREWWTAAPVSRSPTSRCRTSRRGSRTEPERRSIRSTTPWASPTPGCCSPPRSPATSGSRVHAAAAPVPRRPPPVLPRGGREGRPAGQGDLRGHHRDRVPRRLGVHVRGARQGAPGRGGARPHAGDRPLERLHRAQAVPARRRHARAPAPAARVAVGRRPLHERARARPDGRSHRRPRVVRRRGEAGPAVPRLPVGPPGRALRPRPAHGPAAEPGVLLGPRERLGDAGLGGAARRPARGPPGAGGGAREASGPHPERGQAAVGDERALAPDARQAGLVPGDLGLGHLRLLHRPRDQPRAGSHR